MTTTTEELTAQAQARHPRCSRWWGTRGGGTRKIAVCYACDVVIDTWAAKYAMPKHARTAVAEHEALHLGNEEAAR